MNINTSRTFMPKQVNMLKGSEIHLSLTSSKNVNHELNGREFMMIRQLR